VDSGDERFHDDSVGAYQLHGQVLQLVNLLLANFYSIIHESVLIYNIIKVFHPRTLNKQ
jgi:hypothetical protein